MRQAYLSQAQLVTVLPSCINDSLLIFSEYLILRLKRGCMTEEQLSDIIVINRRWVGGGEGGRHAICCYDAVVL